MTFRSRDSESMVLFRGEELRTRAVDEKARRATFVAATEVGVRSWFGSEWLRAAGVKLERFQRNPVILDSHVRDEAGRIVGRATKTWVEGREVLVEVEFATTKRAEEIWDLVRTGFLRAVSVGYWPIKWTELERGQFDGEGAARVEGPGVVVTEWELLEISMVPVPADQFALLRARAPRPFGPVRTDPMDFSAFMAGLGASSTPAGGNGNTRGEPAPAAPVPAPATPAPAAPTTQAAPAAPSSTAPAVSGHAGSPPSAPAPAPATQAAPAAPAPTATQAAAATDNEVRRRDVLAIAPTELRGFAEQLVLRGLGVEQARQELLAELAKRSAPVGTPEPAQPTKPEAEKDARARVADLSGDDIARAFTS